MSPTTARAEAARAIVAELQAGISVERNFRRLIALYCRAVERFFAKRGFSPEDCLDLTQETFLGIYTGMSAFRGDASFDTWLFKIATNVYRKRRRWQGAGKRLGEEVALAEEATGDEPAVELPADGSPAPDVELLSRERSRLLRRAVEAMPRQMRRCLMLRVYQDLKYREIAAVMQISIETVKAHLFQARSRLQEATSEGFGALAGREDR